MRHTNKPITKAKLAYAKGLKKKATAGERAIRPYLYAIGYDFQKFDPIGYLPDFTSSAWCCAVEIDGGIHDRPDIRQQDRLKARRRMKQAGYYTIRLSDLAAKERPLLNSIRILVVSISWRWLRFIFYR